MKCGTKTAIENWEELKSIWRGQLGDWGNWKLTGK
jgi:hypothetical protein